MKQLKIIFTILALVFAVNFNGAAENADWSKPTNLSTKGNVLGEIRAIAASAAVMDFTGDTNLPTGSSGTMGPVRLNRTTLKLQEYLSGTWTNVDLTPVGTVSMTFATAAPTGYLMLQGGTIGDASSGGTALASSSASALFTQLWNSLANSEAAVSGGRGASAAADFAAHKTLTLPDMRQRFPMGKAASGTGSTLGGTGGNIDHTHSVPAHYHGMGTGADLNITSSGTHTTAIDHDHAAFTSAQGGSKAYRVIDGTPDGTNHTAAQQPSYHAGGTFADYTDTGWMGADHTHSIDVPAFTGNSASTGAHTHPSGNFAGSIGLVTGGVSGNAAMTSGTGNPPFLTMNFIIKY